MNKHSGLVNKTVFKLIFPAISLCFLFVLWPMFELVNLSMQKTDFITREYVGIDNYIKMFSNEAFLQSLQNTLLYILILVPGEVGLALIIGLMLVGLPKKWSNGARIAFYLPVLAGGVIISQLWRWFFSPNGLFNWLFDAKIAWFGSMELGVPVISFIIIISSFGSYLIIILASILSVDKSIIEAAKIDGANSWQVKTKIITPIVFPVVATCLTLVAIATPQIYETINFLAPYDYTASISYQIYTTAFKYSQHGSAAAMAVFLSVVTAVLVVIKNKVEKA